jgi:N utilization substance protein B
MKSARRRSRELALQGLYAWQLSGEPATGLRSQLADSEDFDKADAQYFDALLRGTIEQAAEIERQIAPALDRKLEQLSPVERGILMLAAFELRSSPEVPYKVVINEAVELAKAFGGTDGHKYVNGVLDRLAKALRPSEAA